MLQSEDTLYAGTTSGSLFKVHVDPTTHRESLMQFRGSGNHLPPATVLPPASTSVRPPASVSVPLCLCQSALLSAHCYLVVSIVSSACLLGITSLCALLGEQPLVAVGCKDGTVVIMDTDTRETLKRLRPHTTPVCGLAANGVTLFGIHTNWLSAVTL